MAHVALVPKSQTTQKRQRNSQEAEVEGIGRKALDQSTAKLSWSQDLVEKHLLDRWTVGLGWLTSEELIGSSLSVLEELYREVGGRDWSGVQSPLAAKGRRANSVDFQPTCGRTLRVNSNWLTSSPRF